MNDSKNLNAIAHLQAKYSQLIEEYARCIDNDDVFEKKRNLLRQMREIEREIKLFGADDTDIKNTFGYF